MKDKISLKIQCIVNLAIVFGASPAISEVVWSPVSGQTQNTELNRSVRFLPEDMLDKTESINDEGPIWVPVVEGRDEWGNVIWEANKPADEIINTNKGRNPPANINQALEMIKEIPINAEDFFSPLRLSATVPTSELMPVDQWKIAFTNISPFTSDKGTGNQNYSVNLDWGFSKNIMFSAFVSQADDPLNAKIKDFSTQPANYWESYGLSTRIRLLKEKNWAIAFDGSLEGWGVGSGGDDSFEDSGDDASPNIFNDSGRRVFTRNITGSLRLPFTWEANSKFQLMVVPGLAFLPSSQGAGQGGAGKFYGDNTFISLGWLYQPIPELGLTASYTQPLGSSTNSFNSNLDYSSIAVLSGGINWNLNPRIGLRGIVTNGFGATPATAILTLPSENKIGYSASFELRPGAADTPQKELTSRQKSLAMGGLTVNTALVPKSGSKQFWINADSKENVNGFLGYSASNIFQLFLFSGGVYNNVPQDTPQARLYANDGAYNWRVGGKAVAFSPLRGAPFWGSGRITLGRNSDTINNTGQGYVYTELINTWEATEKLALNFNPKVAWSGVGSLTGIGISANIQLLPGWELIPETNIVMNNLSETNGTIGVRWNANKKLTADIYASSAASTLDIGQLLSAKSIGVGTKVTFSF